MRVTDVFFDASRRAMVCDDGLASQPSVRTNAATVFSTLNTLPRPPLKPTAPPANGTIGSAVPLTITSGIGLNAQGSMPAGMLAMTVPTPANSSAALHAIVKLIMPPLEMPAT